jgi:signal transduction histidine kinase
MSKRAVWLQLLIGWVPVWGFLTAVIAMVHGISWQSATFVALRSIIAAAFLGLFVQRLAERHPWPRPVRPGFVLLHVACSFAYGLAWLFLNSVIESVVYRHVVIPVGPGFGPFMVAGISLYLMVAGVSYASAATERVARAEAETAKAKLAGLRSQLNPHFLFNALHTVVHLIPREPQRAAQAAEQLADLLRGAIEEDRDLVSVGDEWAFVERYLDLERIRFGDRLRVHVDMSDEARAAFIPVFAVQTLVENAVRHGAAPRVEPTDISITATTGSGVLTFVVHDTGGGATAEQLEQNGGTGIKRLRDRLAVLYGRDARLDFARGSAGFAATLVIPDAASDA